jgi:DNA helicase HerA-like ATPase
MTLATPAPTTPAPSAAAPRPTREPLGRVLGVSGAQVTVGLNPPITTSGTRPTVGKFLGVISGGSVIIGMITEVSERPLRDQDPNCRSVASLDLVGEIKANAAGVASFQRGITEYPTIGEPAMLMSERELRLIFSGVNAKPSNVGILQQDQAIPATVDVEQLVSKHFAVLGTTGVGKSSGVVILLQQTLAERPDLRIFLIDPHNEYGHCFGDKAQVLTPRNLRLPFWLFNFEETIDAFFGGRPGVEEEVEILFEAIPDGEGRLPPAQGVE